MEERLDNILKNLVDLAEETSKQCVEEKTFKKEVVESVAIVLSIAYGRWCGNGNK